MKNLSAIGFALALCGAAVSTGFAAPAPAGTVTLHGHVPAVAARLQPQGPVASDTTLNLAIGLPLRNKEALTNLLQDIYDPASPNFHGFITPEQFIAQFGPSDEDYQKVIAFAQKNGFKVTGTHPNRMLLDVSASAANVEKAFSVKLNVYQHPAENRTFFAPDTDPSVDASVPILHVSGLSDYSAPHPRVQFHPLDQFKGTSPKAGSGPAGLYQGSDFRNGYVPGTTLTGTGQNVGLLEFDGFYSGDVAAYERQIGLANNAPQIVVVPVNGGVTAPSFGNTEVALDIDMILSMSPGVSKIYVYEAPNGSPWVDILNRMANDNSAKQLSCSWYIPGGRANAVTDQIFQQMAVQGQSFFDASGDADAYTGLIDFPGDTPFITQVGGTTLTMRNAGLNWASETVWNWGIRYGIDGIGSGGGVSTFYPIPPWQTNINFTASHASSARRNTPDVALTADDIYVIADGGAQYYAAGTSAAAPLWAAFTALVNQQAALSSRAAVGFINPAVYSIANSTNYTNCFHDITTGNNRWSGSPNLFDAVSNYDLCTGLGTPNGTNLIKTLVAMGPWIVHLSPPPPPYGTNFAALYGSNPNGSWNLFVQDDKALDSGVISNGWILNLTTADVVGKAGDLALQMGASTSNLLVGGNVTYTIAVTNWGPSTSSNVLVSDTYPTEATLVSTNATQGTVARSGATVIWNVGTLATNTGARLTLGLQFNTVGSFVNYAIASSPATPDPNPDDDIASATLDVSVAQPPQLSGVFEMTNGAFQFAVSNNVSTPTIIQASTNLASTNWVNIYTGAPPFIFTDPKATNYPSRFYRAFIAP